MSSFHKMVAGCLVWGLAALSRAADPVGVAAGSSLTVGSGSNETHVVAHRADYEISKNILVLDGDVVVRDPRVMIQADQITMVMNTNREPEMVTAVGHVVIEQDLNPVPAAGVGNAAPKALAVKGFRRATCGRAVYGVRSGVTVLTDKPVITQEGMTLNGSRIIYSRDQDKVHIDNSSGTFVPGEGQSGMGDLMKPKKSEPKSKE
jgi:lipopolysaccharide transport protein LptA